MLGAIPPPLNLVSTKKARAPAELLEIGGTVRPREIRADSLHPSAVVIALHGPTINIAIRVTPCFGCLRPSRSSRPSVQSGEGEKRNGTEGRKGREGGREFWAPVPC